MRLSITYKLLALIGLTTGAVVLFLVVYFPAQQIGAARAALRRKAATYGTLVSRQVAPAITFDDRETAREIFDAAAQDPDVESLTLLTSSGSTLHSRGVTAPEADSLDPRWRLADGVPDGTGTGDPWNRSALSDALHKLDPSKRALSPGASSRSARRTRSRASCTFRRTPSPRDCAPRRPRSPRGRRRPRTAIEVRQTVEPQSAFGRACSSRTASRRRPNPS